MSVNNVIGTVVSDQDTPTFEIIRIKLKAGQDVKPGTLIRIPVSRTEKSALIGRVRSAYEHNPNEVPDAINVRDTLGIPPNYPGEEVNVAEFDPWGHLARLERRFAPMKRG